MTFPLRLFFIFIVFALAYMVTVSLALAGSTIGIVFLCLNQISLAGFSAMAWDDTFEMVRS